MGTKKVIEIPSETKYAKKVSSAILKDLSSYVLDENKIFDIKLCVEEAVINAVVHGNKGDKSLPVRITYWTENGELSVEVEDKGAGFDHGHLSDPTESANIMKGSGRGVYLIKKLMDKVEYDDSGNKIRMTKNI